MPEEKTPKSKTTHIKGGKSSGIKNIPLGGHVAQEAASVSIQSIVAGLLGARILASHNVDDMLERVRKMGKISSEIWDAERRVINKYLKQIKEDQMFLQTLIDRIRTRFGYEEKEAKEEAKKYVESISTAIISSLKSIRESVNLPSDLSENISKVMEKIGESADTVEKKIENLVSGMSSLDDKLRKAMVSSIEFRRTFTGIARRMDPLFEDLLSGRLEFIVLGILEKWRLAALLFLRNVYVELENIRIAASRMFATTVRNLRESISLARDLYGELMKVQISGEEIVTTLAHIKDIFGGINTDLYGRQDEGMRNLLKDVAIFAKLSNFSQEESIRLAKILLNQQIKILDFYATADKVASETGVATSILLRNFAEINQELVGIDVRKLLAASVLANKLGIGLRDVVSSMRQFNDLSSSIEQISMINIMTGSKLNAVYMTMANLYDDIDGYLRHIAEGLKDSRFMELPIGIRRKIASDLNIPLESLEAAIIQIKKTGGISGIISSKDIGIVKDTGGAIKALRDQMPVFERLLASVKRLFFEIFGPSLKETIVLLGKLSEILTGVIDKASEAWHRIPEPLRVGLGYLAMLSIYLKALKPLFVLVKTLFSFIGRKPPGGVPPIKPGDIAKTLQKGTTRGFLGGLSSISTTLITILSNIFSVDMWKKIFSSAGKNIPQAAKSPEVSRSLTKGIFSLLSAAASMIARAFSISTWRRIFAPVAKLLSAVIRPAELARLFIRGFLVIPSILSRIFSAGIWGKIFTSGGRIFLPVIRLIDAIKSLQLLNILKITRIFSLLSLIASAASVLLRNPYVAIALGIGAAVGGAVLAHKISARSSKVETSEKSDIIDITDKFNKIANKIDDLPQKMYESVKKAILDAIENVKDSFPGNIIIKIDGRDITNTVLKYMSQTN